MKFGFKYLSEQTPRKILSVAGALGTAGVAGCGFALLRDEIWIAVVLLSLAVGGTFVAKLFAENP